MMLCLCRHTLPAIPPAPQLYAVMGAGDTPNKDATTFLLGSFASAALVDLPDFFIQVASFIHVYGGGGCVFTIARIC